MEIVRQVVERSLQQEEMVHPPSEKERQLMTGGLDFTTLALAAAMQVNNIEILKQQLAWSNDRLPHDGVRPEQVLTRLRRLMDVIRDTLAPADSAAVNQYVGFLVGLQEEFLTSTAQVNERESSSTRGA